LILKAKAKKNRVDFKVAFEMDSAKLNRSIEKGSPVPAVRVPAIKNGVRAVSGKVRSLVSTFAVTVHSRTKSLFNFDGRRSENWYRGDVKNENLYRLGYLLRPPILVA
jgi:hypothetical protein